MAEIEHLAETLSQAEEKNRLTEEKDQLAEALSKTAEEKKSASRGSIWSGQSAFQDGRWKRPACQGAIQGDRGK